MNELQTIMRTIDFYGDDLIAVRHSDGRIFVPMRRVCEAIGLSWQPQLTKLRTSEWSEGVTEIVTPQNRNGGSQAEVCLNVEFLPMFLAQIKINKVRPEVQPKLMIYKTEARRVLAEAFLRPESSMSVNKYDDHPMMNMTRRWLEQQEQINKLIIENTQIKLAVKGAEDTVERLITHRKGEDSVPEGTLTLPMIRRRYFFGVSEANISVLLDEWKHAKIPYTYELKDGVDMPSYCYAEDGLDEKFERLLQESRFDKETPQRYMFTHPLLEGRFAMKKEEIPPDVIRAIGLKLTKSMARQ